MITNISICDTDLLRQGNETGLERITVLRLSDILNAYLLVTSIKQLLRELTTSGSCLFEDAPASSMPTVLAD